MWQLPLSFLVLIPESGAGAHAAWFRVVRVRIPYMSIPTMSARTDITHRLQIAGPRYFLFYSEGGRRRLCAIFASGKLPDTEKHLRTGGVDLRF